MLSSERLNPRKMNNSSNENDIEIFQSSVFNRKHIQKNIYLFYELFTSQNESLARKQRTQTNKTLM